MREETEIRQTEVGRSALRAFAHFLRSRDSESPTGTSHSPHTHHPQESPYFPTYSNAPEEAEDELLLRKIPALFHRFRYLIIALSIVGAALGQLKNFTTTPTYIARSVVNIGVYTPSKDGYAGKVLMEQTSRQNYTKTQLPLLRSGALAEKAISRSKPVQDYLKSRISLPELPRRDAAEKEDPRIKTMMIEAYLRGLSYEEVKDTSMVGLIGSSSDPNMAAELANAQAAAFRDMVHEQTLQSTAANLKYLKKNLDTASEKVEKLREDRLAYARDHGIVLYGSGVSENANETQMLDSMNNLSKSLYERVETQAGYQQMKENKQAPDPLKDGTQAVSQFALAKQERELETLKKYYGNNSGVAKYAEVKVEEARKALQDYSRLQVNSARQRYNSARKKELTFKREVERMHERQVEESGHRMQLQVLSKELSLAEEMRVDALRRYQDAAFEAENGQQTVSIVDSAMPPTAPAYPKKGLNLSLGFLLGALTGLMIALFLDFSDNTLHTLSELQRTTDTPALVRPAGMRILPP
jgi:polysaccharide biosynthesis transport protein